MSIVTTIEVVNQTLATAQVFTVTTVSTGFTVVEGGSGGDHGALTGLGDDDHAQYHNDARGDIRYYTKTQLDGGQLDTRYFTESETTALLAGKFDIPTGDTTQYISGNGSLVAFPVAGQAGTLVRQVRNQTGATLTKGTVIYLNGASGNKPLALKAIANSDATSDRTFGVIQADISNNSNGYAVVSGDLGGLDTSALTEGEIFYLSGTVAGAATATQPAPPLHSVVLGVVTRSHATQGQVDISIQNGYELDDLHDVSFTSLGSNDFLYWDGTLWRNKQLAIVDTAGLQTALDNKQPLATVLTNTTASFTTAQESKLSGIAAGAEVNVNADWNSVSGDSQILNKPSTFTPSAHSHAIADVTGLQAALDGKQPLSAVLTNTTAAFTTAQETKLSGIAAGATANSSDATLLSRANHTGTQTASTISDFNTAADARITAATGVSIQAFDADLSSLAALSGTNDIYYRSGAATWSPVTIGANLSFTGGTLAGTGGGGSVTSGTSTVSFGGTATNEASLVVTGQTGILAGSKVIASIGTSATGDYTADDHKYLGSLGVSVTVGNVVAGTGFTIFIRSVYKMTGDISVNWIY